MPPEVGGFQGLNMAVVHTGMTSVKPTTSSDSSTEPAQQNCIENVEAVEHAMVERELQRQQELQQQLARMQRACAHVLVGLASTHQTTRRLLAEREQLLDHLGPMIQQFGLTLESLLESQDPDSQAYQGNQTCPDSQSPIDSAPATQDQDDATEVMPREARARAPGRRRRGGCRRRRNRNRNQSLNQSQAASARTAEKAKLAVISVIARFPVAAPAA